MTRERLQRAAVQYLQRFPSSVQHFRTIMQRKLTRSQQASPGDPSQHREWLAAVEAMCLRAGLLDDAMLSKAVARSLNRRGSAVRDIRQRLRQKGFDAPEIDQSINALNVSVTEERGLQTDLYAALRYAKRRRFGPYRRAEIDWKTRQKQMAALARRGFSFDTARQVIDLDLDDPILRSLD